MTDTPEGGESRVRGAVRRQLRRRFAPLWLVAVLTVTLLLPAIPGLELANPDRTRVSQMRASLADLPDDPLVLVAFDPDIGSYPEIRFVVRTLLGELLDSGALLAIASYTPDGRALADAELSRLEQRAAPLGRILDLGFRSGAEAALVSSVDGLLPAGAEGRVADAVREAGDGLAAFDAVLIVAGNDLGPRVWIEQVATRVPELPLIAVAPTFLQAELQPYLASGQLVALLGTLRDGAAFAQADGPAPQGDAAPPRALPILVGLLAALAVLLEASGGRLVAAFRVFTGARR